MKTLKPFLLIPSALLVVIILFAFKGEEPKKEYLSISIAATKGSGIIIYPSGEVKNVDIKFDLKNPNSIDQEINKALNDLANENWTLKSSLITGTSLVFILERTKQ